MKKIIAKSYFFITNAKQLFLKGNLGIVTDCKHNPSCGKYFLIILEKEGIFKAILKGSVRILTCW